LNITIVAATGGVGRQILEQAEAAGHHAAAVLEKLGVRSRTEAVSLGVRKGLVPL